MKRSYTSMLSGSLVLAMAVAVPAVAGNGNDGRAQDAKADKYEELQSFDCGDGDVVTISGDPVLWPPNHKYSDYDVVATADEEGESILLGTGVTHDEYVGGAVPFAPEDEDEAATAEEPEEENGAGNTTDDAAPLAEFNRGSDEVTNSHDIRSERSGRGNGRTYTISFWAQFGDNEPCEGSTTVEVPHDMRSDSAPEAKDRIGNG
jgi:hypothetical protein